MASCEGFHEDDDLVVGGNTNTTSFSQLLFSNDDDVVGLDMDHAFHCPSSTGKPPKILCFGGYQNIEAEIGLFTSTKATKMSQMTTPQISGLTCSTDSSSACSGNNNNNKRNVNINTTISNSNRERNGSGQVPMQCTSINAVPRTPVPSRRTGKKTKTENPTLSGGHAKVRREKLGDRITALQQLVSPFGKTDTASVLHEAMGYIRFLHDQVQVLCSPYLQHLPGGVDNGGGGRGGESAKDLRSRGLCLVPVEHTVHVASSNGADYWSPAMVNHNVFSSLSSSWSSNRKQ